MVAFDPDWVLVNGNEERHQESAYYLEWREGTNTLRRERSGDCDRAPDAAKRFLPRRKG